jgi:hypothetical protein
MSGRFGNRWRYRNRVRYARGRYSGRRVGAARRARGNARAANQQNDISNVTINLMKKVKAGVISFKDDNGEKYDIGTVALNIFELLKKSDFYQSYSNMYDQFRINRVQVKLTPITWKTYNQFNVPDGISTAAVIGNIGTEQNPVAGVYGNVTSSGEPVYPNGYGPESDSAFGSKYIVPQALTIVTAWDRTGLDDTQLKEIHVNTGTVQAPVDTVFETITIGDRITSYSSAKSTQLVAGANFNCVRYLYPSSQQEKSLYFSTSELVDQFKDTSKRWYGYEKVDDYGSSKITNIHSDPNCPFKPTFLVGVLKVDETQAPNPTAPATNSIPEDSIGQIFPVTFNLEFDIGVTFRGLRKTQVV